MLEARRADGFTGKGRYKRRLRHYRQGRRRATGRGDYNFSLMNMGGMGAGSGAGSRNTLVSGAGGYFDGSGIVGNSLISGGTENAGLPQFAPHNSEYCVSKTEFCRSIYAPEESGSFQNTVLTLQPGLQETFPWLGLVAPQFEEYEFKQLMWYWRPMVSDFNSGTGQVGEIIMVTQYNPSDPPFEDSLRAKSYDASMSTKTSKAQLHGVECEPALNSGAPGKYVRVGPLTTGTNQDLKQYDLGNFNLIVTGTPPEYSGQLLGELWCAYTVVLRKPKLPTTTGSTILRDYFQSGSQGSSNPLDPVNDSRTAAAWPILYGAQNRINNIGEGCLITAARGSFKISYQIPTWYTGALKLKFTLSSPQWKMGSQYGQRLPLTSPDFAEGPIIATVDFPTDAIRLISDLTRGLGSGSSVNTIKSADTYAGGGTVTVCTSPGSETTVGPANQQLIYEVDIQVLSQSTTAPYFAAMFTAARNDQSTSTLAFQGWTLDVTEYNDSFNTTAGFVALQDLNGNPASSPW